jgi:dTMP kinase
MREPVDPVAEALLFSACRAQLVSEVIVPSLARGVIVVADRFADSTLAYQGAGRGLPEQVLEILIEVATHSVTPDLTLLLDVPTTVGLERRYQAAGGKNEAPSSQLTLFEELGLAAPWNRFEDETIAFHERVRAAYLDLARREPKRWVVVNAASAPERVRADIWSAVSERLKSAHASDERQDRRIPSPLVGEGEGGG